MNEYIRPIEIGYVSGDNNRTKHQDNTIYDPSSISKTLLATDYKKPMLVIDNGGGSMNNETNDIKIRKLTPKECFRLQGFDDYDADVVSLSGISNTQMYKMAGNSITVNVLEAIFTELFKEGVLRE